MTRLRVLISRCCALFRKQDLERELDEELKFHLQQEIEHHIAQGLTPEGATQTALRRFGGMDAAKEAYREAGSIRLVETFFQDVRHTFRILRNNPGVAGLAILSLALGVGANTAIFRVLDAVVLRSLPVRNPEQLVLLGSFHDGELMGFSYPLFREMAARQNAVQGIFVTAPLLMDGQAFADGRPLVQGFAPRLASGGYFRLLGVDAQIGRIFTDEDDQRGSLPVAVISDSFWKRNFGRNPDVIRRTIMINNISIPIIGVTPQGFFGESIGSAPDVWIPINLLPLVSPSSNWLEQAGSAMLSPMARLRPDVAQPQAQAALNLLYKQLADFNIRLTSDKDLRLELRPGNRGPLDLQQRFSTALWVLMAAVGLLALLTCCNIANLLLARATARAHEIGLRVALGASRGRLIRQLVTESIVLAACSGVAGLVISVWLSQLLVDLALADAWSLSMDAGWIVTGFTILISIAAVCVFGLIPALLTVKPNVSGALQRGRAANNGSPFRQTAVRALIVTQISISLLLVSGASLLGRSFWNLLHQDFGYRPERVLRAHLAFGVSTFKVTATPAFRETVLEQIKAIPGVVSAALTNTGPLENLARQGTMALPDPSAEVLRKAWLSSVSVDYFTTMGIPIISGRPFDFGDRSNTERVAIISETAAHQVFGKTNPLGRLFTNGERFDAGRAIRIVGVSADIRFSSPREPFSPVIFQPIDQVQGPVTSVVLQTSREPALISDAVEKVLHNIAPSLKLTEITPLSITLQAKVRQERMLAFISSALGSFALILASVGLYGVITYAVARRTNEIGIRIALGSKRSSVFWMVLRESMVLVMVGVVCGVPATLAASRFIASQLFGLGASDPRTLLAAVSAMFVITAVAGFFPAYGATKVDPLTAVRHE